MGVVLSFCFLFFCASSIKYILIFSTIMADFGIVALGGKI